MRPAFFSIWNDPLFLIVLSPLADTLTVIFFPSSGIKSVFFWMFTWRRREPVGLNLVARVRLEYPPPTRLLLLVITHVFAIRLFKLFISCLPREMSGRLSNCGYVTLFCHVSRIVHALHSIRN